MKYILSILLCLLIASTVMGSSINAPKLVEGQFVYTVPSGFDPDGIGRNGLNEIQDVIQNLHYPYYVVIVDEFDGETDEDAAQVIDTLAATWQKNPIFDVNHSSIFLLSYNPRKYRFLAGTDWKVKLGFEREAHVPYTNMFLEYAKGTPSDPKTGIIEMMKAVDEYLFDQTDPARIDARAAEAKRQAEISRKQRIQEQLEMARSSLDNEVLRTETLLKSSPRFLPDDVQSYQTLLAQAKEARRTDNKSKMLNAANNLRSSNDSLGAYIGQLQRKAFAANAWRFLVFLLFATFIIMLVKWILNCLQAYEAQKTKFYADINKWKEKVTNARDTYVKYYYNRKGIITLQDSTGETKKLYDEVTAAVDLIFLASTAMSIHIETAESKASKINKWSFFSLNNPGKIIKKASDYLLAEFEFDTGQSNRNDLFGKPTKTIKGTLESMEKDSQDGFNHTRNKWTKLEEASNTILTSAHEAFPISGFDEIAKVADDNGIPHRWLQKHPLAGDDKSDASLYEQLDELRKTDPISYIKQLEELIKVQEEVKQAIDKIASITGSVISDCNKKPPVFNDIVIDKLNDPSVTFDTMQRELSTLSGLLAHSDSIDEIANQVNHLIQLKQIMDAQVLTLQKAISESKKHLSDISKEYEKLQDLQIKVEAEINKRKGVYQHVDSINAQFASAKKDLESMPNQFNKAKGLFDNKHVIEAANAIAQCTDKIYSIKNTFNNCVDTCNQLDRQKQEYEAKLASMDGIRAAAKSKIHKYGYSVDHISDYSAPAIYGLANYALLLSQLNQVEDKWNSQVRSAEQDYREQQRQAEEAERRKRQEEQRREEEHRRAEQRRRDSYSSGSSWGSSSSSSSGGSWGSSSSSSSGGSWGGGGSSSSGGSW